MNHLYQLAADLPIGFFLKKPTCINWDNLSVWTNAPDREIQETLLDITTEHGLIYVHNQHTRQENILDLVFQQPIPC